MSNTTIAQKLQLALNNKSEIKSSLIAKGINVGDKMSEWSDAIDNAPMGGVEPIRATFAGSNSEIKIMDSANWYNYGISKLLANDQEVNTTTLPANIDGYDVEYYTLTLPGSAFNECGRLTSVTIPNSVIYIGRYAFKDCSLLTSITIPDSVTVIADYAFSGCSGLTKAEFASIESLCKIEFLSEDANPLYYAHHLYINGQEVTDVVIPNSITRINYCTFMNCSSLTSITIPDSVTFIGYRAFAGCSGLTSVTIPNSVTRTDGFVFYNCSSLAAIYSDGLRVELDVSHSRQQFDAESIQSVIDTWQEGGAIIFSSESALDLKGKLIVGEKAHWEGNTLMYGKGGGGYYY